MGGVTLIGIVGDELVEVQLSSEWMLEYILTSDNLNRAYKQVIVGHKYEDTKEGVPQGEPLSPILSNIMLNELDCELKSRGLPFVRYADDSVIFCRSPRTAQSVCVLLRKRLCEVN